MKEEHKKKIPPTQERQLGDVYMMYSPDGTVNGISAGTLIYKNFNEFMKYAVCLRKSNKAPFHMNDFFVHYRFDDPAKIPLRKTGENSDQYLDRVQNVLNEVRLKPENIYRLYQLIYCDEKGLNPYLQKNAPQELEKSQEYKNAIWRYTNFGEALEHPSYHGIETEKGVLLFDGTIKGEQLQQRYIDFHIENFFDPRLKSSFLHKVDIIPNEEQKVKINPDVKALFSDKSLNFGQLPDYWYTDIKDIPIAVRKESYDMAPTAKNLSVLAGLDKDNIALLVNTYDIISLMFLGGKDCNHPEIQDEYPNLFSYHERFDPLVERYEKAETEGEKTNIINEVRTLAKQILKEDFPNIRQPITIKRENVKQSNPVKDSKSEQTNKVELSLSKNKLPSSKKRGMKM